MHFTFLADSRLTITISDPAIALSMFMFVFFFVIVRVFFSVIESVQFFCLSFANTFIAFGDPVIKRRGLRSH